MKGLSRFSLLLLVFLACSAHAGVIYDPLVQFDTVNNPSPTGWSYGKTTSPGGGGAFSLLLYGTPNAGNFDWYPAANDVTANVELWQGSALSLRADSVVRWTSSISGTAAITATFQGWWSYPPGTTEAGVHVLLNGASLFNHDIVGYQSANFSSSVAIHPGDTIDFTVGPDSYGSSTDWSRNKLEAQIDAQAGSEIPEPSTYALLGTGLAGLLAWCRRRAV